MLSFLICFLVSIFNFFPRPVAGVSGLHHGINVENAYVRAAAEQMTSAAYFKIVNSSDQADTLYDVKAGFAEMAQLHESFHKNGMVGMKQIYFVVVPAKSSVEFKPGGYHVMVMNVKEDLKIGTTVRLELLFKHGGTVEVNADVKK
ncbi:MAG: copper chaperone PCu(A)C [Candidatus Kryptoniota bacterium]